MRSNPFSTSITTANTTTASSRHGFDPFRVAAPDVSSALFFIRELTDWLDSGAQIRHLSLPDLLIRQLQA